SAPGQEEGSNGKSNEEDGDQGGGAEDGVVIGIPSVMEEKVVGGAQAGRDGHVDFYKAALESCGDDVESSQGQAERGPCGGGVGGGGEAHIGVGEVGGGGQESGGGRGVAAGKRMECEAGESEGETCVADGCPGGGQDETEGRSGEPGDRTIRDKAWVTGVV